MSSTYSERLRAAIAKKGINRTELAKQVSKVVGRSVSPQAIQYLTSESKKAQGSSYTTAIAQVLGVDPAELATGKPDLVIDGMQIELKTNPQNYREAPPKDKKRIPVINSIPAGGPRQIIDGYPAGAGMDEIEVSNHISDYAFALVLEGNSMEPDFRDGDKVVIDPELKPIPGDFVAARCQGDHGTFKKYRPRGVNEHGVEMFDLVPLNEDYPILHETAETCNIAGVLVEHHKYFRRRTR
jgi:SOS-response transcriptional repressor LexA